VNPSCSKSVLLTKMEYLQTLKGNIITSQELNKKYNKYVCEFYLYHFS